MDESLLFREKYPIIHMYHKPEEYAIANIVTILCRSKSSEKEMKLSVVRVYE